VEFRIWNAGHEFQIPTSQSLIVQTCFKYNRPVRVTNYDSIASKYDRRYDLYEYAGSRETLANFLGDAATSVLEVGCGTGHWLDIVVTERSAPAFAERPFVAGVEPSSEMMARARATASGARLIRGAAETLPFLDATFDRIYCMNALHHFRDRVQFFAEARRILKPGGGLLSIGKDPHAERDTWWVYDYFPETVDIDRAHFARVRTLRGELAAAGFSWAESFECDHLEAMRPAGDALTTGIVDRAFTSQLTVLSQEEFEAGKKRIEDANAAVGGELQLATDFYLFATIGWV
jgi:ubiquinone/menaquinone biosynthesis C-methylase UbiE